MSYTDKLKIKDIAEDSFEELLHYIADLAAEKYYETLEDDSAETRNDYKIISQEINNALDTDQRDLDLTNYEEDEEDYITFLPHEEMSEVEEW